MPPAHFRKGAALTTKSKYLPALGLRALTPLYDPLLRSVMREETFKRRPIALADLAGGRRVLDLGCGTGTLTLLAKQTHPDADVVGIDPDPEVLSRARSKAVQAGVAITWDEGLATDVQTRFSTETWFGSLTIAGVSSSGSASESAPALARAGECARPDAAWASSPPPVRRPIQPRQEGSATPPTRPSRPGRS